MCYFEWIEIRAICGTGWLIIKGVGEASEDVLIDWLRVPFLLVLFYCFKTFLSINMLTIWRDLICVAFVCRYLICCHCENMYILGKIPCMNLLSFNCLSFLFLCDINWNVGKSIKFLIWNCKTFCLKGWVIYFNWNVVSR